MKKRPGPQEMWNLLPTRERKRVVSTATILAELVNEYDPRLRCRRKTLLYEACVQYEARLQERKKIPNFARFLLTTMNDLADEKIDEFVRKYAVDDGGLTNLDRDQHIREVLAMVKASLTDPDKEEQQQTDEQKKDAERVLDLMLKGYRLPDIDRICGRSPHWAEGVLKRIRRRANTYLRSRILLRRRN
jgi:hypothetical protein